MRRRDGVGAQGRAFGAGVQARRFARAEDGALMIFGIFVLAVMLTAAGLAIDTMRHERERARLQTTLDRAVLAAADLDHILDPTTVVEDYFEVAGLSEMLGEVTVDERLNHRSVSASAATEMPTLLLGLAGVDSLRAAVASTAEERVKDVEISLVLDVSGSMANFSRLTNLKTAAAEFVDTVMPSLGDPPSAGLTTISIAPYAATVNVGAELMRLYGVERVHDYSSCIRFEDAAFAGTAPTPGEAMRQFDHYVVDDRPYLPGSPRRITDPACPRAPDPGRAETSRLLPLAADAQPLHDTIAGLRAVGSTGTDVGLLWGVALLDPQTRPIVDALIALGSVDASAAGRPHDYRAEDAMKVLVLMTDGDPTKEYLPPRQIRSGPSNVWYDAVTGAYSVLVRGTHLRKYPYGTTSPVDFAALGEPDGIVRVAPGRTDVNDRSAPRWYWVREDGDRIRQPKVRSNKGAFQDYPASQHAASEQARNDWALLDKDLRRLDYREVFERFTRYDFYEYIIRYPYEERLLSYAERLVFLDPDPGAATAQRVVDRARALCEAAKERGVVVFSIGFELGSIRDVSDRTRARGLMRDCASRPENNFDVNAVEISEAFAVIASQIEQLRLTR